MFCWIKTNGNLFNISIFVTVNVPNISFKRQIQYLTASINVLNDEFKSHKESTIVKKQFKTNWSKSLTWVTLPSLLNKHTQKPKIRIFLNNFITAIYLTL